MCITSKDKSLSLNFLFYDKYNGFYYQDCAEKIGIIYITYNLICYV